MCGALPPTLTGPAAEWYVFVLEVQWHVFFGWLAAWRASQNDEETVSEIAKKRVKIDVLGGPGSPWGTMWGPRGGRVTFSTIC